jgi:molybdopterin-binding protein
MISVSNLTSRTGAFELSDVSFTVGQGGYGVVIGPAGSGKTTLLETIAGLIPVRSGTITLGGEDVTRVPPELRRLSIVYQHAYLFPHLTVAGNVAYGAVSASVAREMSGRLGIDHLSNRRVDGLSGGERQLVAIARALARRPEVLLLDEPFAALDNRSRIAARRALRSLYVERRFTTLHVTHDFAEAGMLGDLVMLLDRGRLVQSGAPEDLFRRPANAYIADFLGAENVFAGQVRLIESEDANVSRLVESADGLPQPSIQRAAAFTTGALTLYAVGDFGDGATHAVIRSEEIALSLEPGSSSIRNQFRGTVTELAEAGAVTRVTIDVSGIPFVAAITSRSVEELRLEAGKEVVAGFKATAVHLC